MIAIGEILVLVAVGWLVAKALGIGRDRDVHTTGSLPHGDPADGLPPVRSQTVAVDARDTTPPAMLSPPPVTQSLSPGAQRDQKMAELRRRYVADEITVEEYEAELDRLIRE